MKKVLWIGEVFEDNDVYKEKAISIAANRWQLGFINSLVSHSNVTVELVGRLPRPAFPKGKIITPKKFFKRKNINGQYFSYINIYGIRKLWFKQKYYKEVLNMLKDKGPFDAVFVYNLDSYLYKTLLFIKNRLKIPVYSFVADIYNGVLDDHDALASLCDKVFYLSYAFFKKAKHRNKFFFEGGFDNYKLKNIGIKQKKKIILYTGSLGPHGGVNVLLDAFILLEREDVELWICGKGYNNKLEKILKSHNNIKFLGVVSENKLQEISNQVYAFINPRPTDYPENFYNFPSKILEYFSYQKIIISTKTAGLSPEYEKALELIEDGSPRKMADTINRVLNLDNLEYREKIELQKAVSITKLWSYQINYLLNNEIKILLNGSY